MTAAPRRRTFGMTRKRTGITRSAGSAAAESPPASLTTRGPRLPAILLPLVVAVAGFAAFYPALRAEFVDYDDNKLFVENESYRGLTPAHLRWMFTTTFMGHYQPLTWLSSAVDYQISGTRPTSYHLNNLLLHALCGTSLYFIGRRLLAAAFRLGPSENPVAVRVAAAVAALLFAIHPLRVESVAWATERRDVLSVFFLLLALLAYLRACPPGQVALASRGWLAVSYGLLLLSLLAKAWGMSFVVLVTVLDVYPLRRLPGRVSVWGRPEYRALWLQNVPYLVLGILAAVGAGAAQRSALDTMRSLEEWGLGPRLVQACYGLMFYAWKTIWPTQLSPGHELPYELDPLATQYLVAYVAVPLAAIAILLLRRRAPGLLAAAACYVVLLAPVLGFTQSGPQFVADRYSYVSCIGWALGTAGLLLALWRRRDAAWTAASGVAAIAVLAALFVLTLRQTAVWNNSRSLWAHTLATGAVSSNAHLNLGILLARDDDPDGAVDHYREAVRIRPDLGDAWFALGNALKRQRDYAAAEEAYLQAVQFMTQKHSAWLNLGNMYYSNLRRADDAIAAYRAAIAHMEAHRSKMFTPRAYIALGIALRDKGDYAEARRAFETAARYRETRARAQEELAKLP